MAAQVAMMSLFLVGFLLISQVEADAFLAHLSPGHEAEAAVALRDQLEAALGADHHRAAEARMLRLEDALRPTFAALPKNARGAVDAAAARYALHRLFVQRHGWQMIGLDPAGESWSAASPAAALGNRVPTHVRAIFEGRLGSAGLDLHELALLAATLEQLVHKEALQRLEAAYLAFGWEGSKLTPEEATQVIDAYMASYILGTNASELTGAKAREQADGIQELYPNWPETRGFLREVQQEVAGKLDSFTFFQVASVVEEVGERYGRWQQNECHALKDQLLQLESGDGTGRVRLADFYGSAMNGGQWQFSESTEYLRQLGALDESNPQVLRVIIPNYINGPSNCVASGGYYSVCCIDECEGLLGHLETKLAAPSAEPSRVLGLVAALPSSSLPAGRQLPADLVQRLHDVAAHHGGKVPLHGRLFAQWMHHAYPRECPYPHVTGTTHPQRPEDWEAATGQQVSASEEEMSQHVEASKSRSRSASDPCADGSCNMMWTMEEELVATHVEPTKAADQRKAAMSPLRNAALFAAVFAAALMLVGTLRQAFTTLDAPEGVPVKYVI